VQEFFKKHILEDLFMWGELHLRTKDNMRRYIWSQVPCYLYSSMVASILHGVIQAVEEKKAEWKLG
jgi:uncharacterized membrane protein YcgQ (UPF0703/DUF1980 family)